MLIAFVVRISSVSWRGVCVLCLDLGEDPIEVILVIGSGVSSDGCLVLLGVPLGWVLQVQSF